ncbi:hypothetical protein Tco_0533640 [Tanacetum coccineum]
MKQGWCGQAYKDLLWRSASAISVKEFEKCKSKFDLLLNNICEVFNGKIVGGRDKPVITLLKYIREYCMKRIVNVQSVIDKCTSPLTPTTTKIMESIKKEAHLMKVQWNRANKYQVSEANGSASRQAEHAIGAVIGLSVADGTCSAGDGVGSEGSSHTR